MVIIGCGRGWDEAYTPPPSSVRGKHSVVFFFFFTFGRGRKIVLEEAGKKNEGIHASTYSSRENIKSRNLPTPTPPPPVSPANTPLKSCTRH